MYMHDLGLTSNITGNRLTTITFLSESAGFTNPCRDFRVRKALEVWASGGIRGKNASLPVLPVMKEVLPVIYLSTYKVLLFKAVFLLAFLGAFSLKE